MKICHIINSLDTGGAEIMLSNLLQQLQSPSDVDSFVLTLLQRGELATEVESSGARVISLNWMRHGSHPPRLWQLARVLRTLGPDIVQTWLYHSDLMGAISRLLLPSATRLIWTIHTCATRPASGIRTSHSVRRMNAFLSRIFPTAIVYVSEQARLTHEAMGYRKQGGTVIPNGIDTELFTPSESHRTGVRNELKLAPDTPLVGMLARLHPDKDHRTFLEAAKLLHGRRTDLHFVLAGTNIVPQTPELATMISQFGLEHRVHMLGCRRDAARIHAALDVEVLTTTAQEGFGLVVAEAMACGVPCVATNSGALPQVLDDVGFLVEERDAAAVARSCLALLELSNDERVRLSQRARQRVVTHFSLSKVADRYSELWRTLLCRREVASGQSRRAS